ncbi:AraC family transcriptional regulator [Pseudoalteromonas sp. CO302Y]|uniref:helix-turn-helix transcriptional regulator n=1 Tax=unclassified Pseudoalteromonas TaxID=194690 RepID=UPI001022D860|nr:AraC family transcriptional regulator [Pseudoalteromonas sp. CO302Y]RZG05972.1 AraC family transcriptional regulator [Pseudoalteromonas sp. CO133X]
MKCNDLWHPNHPAEDKQLRPGLNFHFGDEVEDENKVWRGAVNDRFRLIIVLNGKLGLSYGDKQLCLSSEPHTNIHNAALVSCQTPELFSRQSFQGNACKRVSIGISSEWVENTFDHYSGVQEHLQAMPHLHYISWSVSHYCAHIAAEMLTYQNCPIALQSIFLESKTLEIIAEAVSHLHKDMEFVKPPTQHQPKVKGQLLELKKFIQSHPSETHNIADLAARVNMTISTLQRQFKQQFSLTVFEYIHKVRMVNAYLAIKASERRITQIAGDVGYDNAGNFATAFRRHFGMSPSKLRDQNK